MQFDVTIPPGPLSETFQTELALVRHFTRVNVEMFTMMEFVKETFPADFACVSLTSFDDCDDGLCILSFFQFHIHSDSIFESFWTWTGWCTFQTLLFDNFTTLADLFKKKTSVTLTEISL